MRCAKCHRTINPARACSDAQGRKYGPVCGYRLGLVALVQQATKTQQRQFKAKTKTCPLWASPPDAQVELFEGMTA